MTVDYTINNLPAELVIGRRTETGVFDVRIDCAPWLALWPELVLIIWVTPPGGGEQYPATTHMEGDVLVWDVNIVDTAVEGKGTMEVMGLAEGLKKLSTITTTQVLHTTTVSESEIPDSAQGWVDQVLSETAHNVNEAKNSATSAAGYATSAAGYATSAAQSAEAAGASESVAAQSAQASEASAQRAAQSAEDAADQTATEILSTIDGVLSQRDRVWNLLDNSNFQVNQHGTTEISANGYIVDRWFNSTGTSKLTNNGVQVTSGPESAAYLSQFITTIKDGVFTFAAKVNGNIVLRVVQIAGTTVTTISNVYAAYSGGYLQFSYNSSHGSYEAAFRVERENTITIVWTALYEGEYTPETLPDYIPTRKTVETAECQQHYWQIWQNNNMVVGHGYMNTTTEAIITFELPQTMRIPPTFKIEDISTLRMMCVDGLKGITNYTVQRATRNQVAVTFTLNSASVAYTPCVMRSNSGTVISFNAEA